jgi:hypothetical protein
MSLNECFLERRSTSLAFNFLVVSLKTSCLGTGTWPAHHDFAGWLVFQKMLAASFSDAHFHEGE